MRPKTKWWWHGCSGGYYPLAVGTDAGQWVQQKYGTTMWEDDDFSEKLEGVGLE